MHPFIKAFIESDVFLKDLIVDEKDPYFDFISLIQDMSLVPSHSEDQLTLLLERGKMIDDSVILDKELLSLFYFIQAQVVGSFQKSFVQSNKMMKFSFQLLDENSSYVLKSLILSAIGSFSVKLDIAFGYFKRATSLLKLIYPREFKVYIAIFKFYARNGLLVKVQSDFEKILSRCYSSIILNDMKIMQFWDALCRGDIQNADIYLKDIPVEKLPYFSLLPIFKILKGEWNPQDWTDIPTKFKMNGEHLFYIELKKKSSKSSLAAIEKTFPVGSENAAPLYLRVELINKNMVAAKKLVKKREAGLADENQDCLNFFFKSRIALLEGEKERASFYFQKCLSLCDQYKSHGLLDFEIGLAHELKRSDISMMCLKKINKLKFKDLEISNSPVKNSYGIRRFVGGSKSALLICQKIRKYADAELLILVSGETGTGKEIVSKALHEESSRSNEPYLAVNCGAISDSLLQSELFGHTSGAYTGAGTSHKGLFEEAGTGTIFLDEIGEISSQMQIALLRVLESREVRPVGSSKTIPVYCKIIAATNADLESLVRLGIFRKDLFYRLNQLEIRITPLRERKGDIKELLQHYFNLNREDLKLVEFSDEFLQVMENKPWKGNVRELRNEIERLRVLYSEQLFYDANVLMETSVVQKAIIEKTNENIDHVDMVKEKSPNEFSENQPSYIESNTPLRRIASIKKLFLKHDFLTRVEISKALGVNPRTISNDLKKMILAGLIEKKCPTAARRTDYFITLMQKKS